VVNGLPYGLLDRAVAARSIEDSPLGMLAVRPAVMQCPARKVVRA
jgi:hypothetical protein